jgi:3-oxoacyl-[acyl-carrier-protein] synthase III
MGLFAFIFYRHFQFHRFMFYPLRIIGTGVCLPGEPVSSQTLAPHLQTTAAWIEEHSGVYQRHFAGEADTVASLGASALRQALKNASLQATDLDLLICASGSYDCPVPCNASLTGREMGMTHTPCWDLDATCLSFITALDVAGCLLFAQRYRTIGIVSSEIASRSLNYADKETASLLGDGAGAAIVALPPPGSAAGIHAAHMETYPEGAWHTHVKGGGNFLHPRDPAAADSDFTFVMQGRQILRMAAEKLPAFMQILFAGTGFTLADIDLLIPHQASKTGLLMAKKHLDLPENRFYNDLEKHGNCIAASLPIALHHALAEKRIGDGNRICLAGTGAGFSLGGIVLTL